MSTSTLPTVWGLTRGQRSGARCVHCFRLLDEGAVPAGVAVGYLGAHNLSVPVYACPTCPTAETEPSHG